jgi:hypothetical protein
LQPSTNSVCLTVGALVARIPHSTRSLSARASGAREGEIHLTVLYDEARTYLDLLGDPLDAIGRPRDDGLERLLVTDVLLPRLEAVRAELLLPGVLYEVLALRRHPVSASPYSFMSPSRCARASVCMALGGGGWVGEWDQVELSGSAAPLPATRPVIIREASATRNPLAREWRGKLSASKREMEMDVCKAKAMGEQQPEHNVSIT